MSKVQYPGKFSLIKPNMDFHKYHYTYERSFHIMELSARYKIPRLLHTDFSPYLVWCVRKEGFLSSITLSGPLARLANGVIIQLSYSVVFAEETLAGNVPGQFFATRLKEATGIVASVQEHEEDEQSVNTHKVLSSRTWEIVGIVHS